MPRGAGLLFALLLGAGAARAQEGGGTGSSVPPRLSIELSRGTGSEPLSPLVRAEHLMDDGVFDFALHNGFPVRYHFRLELWKDARLFDRLDRDVAWDAVIRLDLLSNVYQLIRTGGTVEHFTTVEAVGRALATAFTVDLAPQEPAGRGDRYYYVATLEIESLSLSELEEVERWLRGDLEPAITRRGDVGAALGRGARRLLIRFSGLPRRRLEARTQTFRY